MPQGPVKMWLLGCNCTLEASRLNPEKPTPSPNPFPELVGFVSVSRFVSDVPSYQGGRLVRKTQARPQLAPFPAGVRRDDVALPLPLPLSGLGWTRSSWLTPTRSNCFRASTGSQRNGVDGSRLSCACDHLSFALSLSSQNFHFELERCFEVLLLPVLVGRFPFAVSFPVFFSVSLPSHRMSDHHDCERGAKEAELQASHRFEVSWGQKRAPLFKQTTI